MGRLTGPVAVVAWLLTVLVAGCAAPDTDVQETAQTSMPTPTSSSDTMPDQFGFGRPATHEEIAA